MTRPTIDDLEVLTPDQLLKMLRGEIQKYSPDVQFIRDLLFVGCPINYGDHNGWTALHSAAWHGELEVVQLLISNGAQVNAQDKDGMTAMHWVVHYVHLEAVNFLISVGSDIHVKDKLGRTAWDVASDKIKKSFPELEAK